MPQLNTYRLLVGLAVSVAALGSCDANRPTPADPQLALIAKGEEIFFNPQLLTDIYFHSSHLANNNLRSGNLTALYILILIAVFILVLACVNYIVLCSAQSVTRLNEVGVRKVVGATRMELVVQILGSSMLMAVLSLPLAIVLLL